MEMGIRPLDNRAASGVLAISPVALSQYEESCQVLSPPSITMERPKCSWGSEASMVRTRLYGPATTLSCDIPYLDSTHASRNSKEPLAQRQYHCHGRRWLCLPRRLSLLGVESQAGPTSIPLPTSSDKPKRVGRLRDRILLLRCLLHLNSTLLLLLSTSGAK